MAEKNPHNRLFELLQILQVHLPVAVLAATIAEIMIHFAGLMPSLMITTMTVVIIKLVR